MFHNYNGASTVDYTLVSTKIFEDVTDFEIFENDTLTHLPQQFTFICNTTDNIENAKIENTDVGCERGIYKWCEDSLVNLSNGLNRELINVFNSYIDTGQPSQAADSLVQAIQNVCRRVKFSKRKQIAKHSGTST